MRVIAGDCRSLQLKAPKGENTRPTLDRIKETLFNMIQSEVPGGVFADLYAGSGAIGIEALSRGAEHAYFIESDERALACIKENLAHCRLTERATVLRGDVSSVLSGLSGKPFDVIFADPPYGAGQEERLFSALLKSNAVTQDALIILEAALQSDFSFDGFTLVREKKYKTNKHLFYRKE